MHIKSKVVATRSPLCFNCFDLERLLTSRYLYDMTFSDMIKIVEDFSRLSKPVQRIILLVLVQSYHQRFQSKIVSLQEGVHEFLLRLIFETLKGINTISCLSAFRKDVFSSHKRDINHQLRMLILVKKCKRLNQVNGFFNGKLHETSLLKEFMMR